MTVQIQYTLEEIDAVVAQCWSKRASCKVFALTGNMGAGKTTFIRVLCRQLGIKDPVSSPTYSLINEYLLPDGMALYHVDLYRLRNVDEAIDAGVVELLSTDAICLIEWPELIQPLLPPDTVSIHIDTLDDNCRLLKMKVPG